MKSPNQIWALNIYFLFLLCNEGVFKKFRSFWSLLRIRFKTSHYKSFSCLREHLDYTDPLESIGVTSSDGDPDLLLKRNLIPTSGGLDSILIFIKYSLSALKISTNLVFFLRTSGEYSKKYRQGFFFKTNPDPHHWLPVCRHKGHMPCSFLPPSS